MNKKSIRVNSIHITNYRGIDNLDLTFPLGRMADDPDVLVIGSVNGVGKTSVLECCAWVLLVASSGKGVFNGLDFDFSDLVKSGCDCATIKAEIDISNKIGQVTITFCKNVKVQTTGLLFAFNGKIRRVDTDTHTLEGIVGMLSNPVLGKCFLFLHSYRKVLEGRLELGTLVDDNISSSILEHRYGIRYTERMLYFSMFKKFILRQLMENANLFETSALKKHKKDSDAIRVLNSLLEKYASVKLGKLRYYANNTIDVQVEKLDELGKGFSIDCLSSGQKEIISTLFLIWSVTYKNPSVVLIDEPEMHLNVEWHSGFIRKLIELSPNNQYIIATHSEAIMASTDKNKRIILKRDEDVKQEASL